MQWLERRLEALEAGAHRGQCAGNPIALHFVNAADPQRDIRSAQIDDETLTLADDENGLALTQRAMRIAAGRQAADGRLRLVFLR